MTLGVIVGMVGGYYRGWVDEVLMRVVDGLMALPSLLLAMLILTTLGSSPVYVVAGIAVVFMPRTARMVRGVALSLGAAEFVDAARLRGESGAYVIFREMLPNAWGPIIVEAPSASATPSCWPPRWASWAWAPGRRPPTGGS